MVTSPDGNGVLMVGGSDGLGMDGILELKSDNQGWVGTWTTLSAKLQYGRYNHEVIRLQMEKDICGVNGIVTTNSRKYISTWS